MSRDSLSRPRTFWHMGFAHLVRGSAPGGYEVRSEVELPRHPRRADLVLIRQTRTCGQEPGVLRGLWPHIERVCLCEFKSPVRGFRADGLYRLLNYGLDYHLMQREQVRRGKPATLEHARELSLALIVPAINAALLAEIAEMGAELHALGNGYFRLSGVMYATLVISTNEVCEAEHDEYLRIFSHHSVQSRKALQWWQTWHQGARTVEDMQDMEGYDEVVAKFLETLTLEKRFLGLKPEERLAGLGPEERLVGLGHDMQLLAMPVDALAALSPEYVASLPPHVQEGIRARIARAR